MFLITDEDRVLDSGDELGVKRKLLKTSAACFFSSVYYLCALGAKEKNHLVMRKTGKMPSAKWKHHGVRMRSRLDIFKNTEIYSFTIRLIFK